MPGNLFTNYFLTEGIKATAEWRAYISDSTAFAAFRNGVRQRYDALSGSEGPNEAVTEQELIRPVLDLLGWADYLPQQGTTRNEDIPDYLLFTDAASKERAAGRANSEERFRDAIVVEESKRFGLSLDARDRDDGRQSRTPHGQILRYLSTADIESESRIRWGFLTNGGLWRLYDYRARPRATGYFEADLGEMLESGGEDGLRLFYLLFRRDSFTPQQGATTSFLEAALAQGRRYEEKVAQDLSSVVFERVFPKLVQALADGTGEDLSRVRHAALILLYRLLFVLYAEDRGLLPVNDPRYEDYGLRKPVRDHVAHRMQGLKKASPLSVGLDPDIRVGRDVVGGLHDIPEPAQPTTYVCKLRLDGLQPPTLFADQAFQLFGNDLRQFVVEAFGEDAVANPPDDQLLEATGVEPGGIAATFAPL